MRKNKKAAYDNAISRAAEAEKVQPVSASILPQKPETEKAESVFIRIPEAMEIMGCSRSTVQRCFVEINKKLRARGCFTIAGRCNRREFYRAIGFVGVTP